MNYKYMKELSPDYILRYAFATLSVTPKINWIIFCTCSKIIDLSGYINFQTPLSPPCNLSCSGNGLFVFKLLESGPVPLANNAYLVNVMWNKSDDNHSYLIYNGYVKTMKFHISHIPRENWTRACPLTLYRLYWQVWRKVS